MGTRSLTHIYDDSYESPKILTTIYRQMDGYPTGMGQDLKDFLSPFTIVNGISLAEDRKIANGAGCLAAQVVAHFKDDVGGFYLYPPGASDCGEEYVYHVFATDGQEIRLIVTDVYENSTLYDGPLSGFDADKCEAA